MSKYMSDQNQLCFIYESGTYGSAIAAGSRHWIGLVQEHTIDENMNVIPIRYQGSTDRNVDMFEDGNLDVTGTYSYFPQDWKQLGFAIGSVSDCPSFAGTGSHVMSETNSDDQSNTAVGQILNSFVLEDSKNNGTAGSNFVRTSSGCMIDSMTTTWSQGEPVSCEVNYMAQSVVFASGAVVAVTPTTTRPFMSNKSLLQIPSGTTIDNAADFAFTVNNNLEAGHYVNGSRVIQEPLPVNRDYELTATVKMDSANAKTFYENYFLGGSEFNAMIQSIGAGGSLFVVMSGCTMTDMETPSPVEGTQDQTLTITPAHVEVTVEDAIAQYTAW